MAKTNLPANAKQTKNDRGGYDHGYTGSTHKQSGSKAK